MTEFDVRRALLVRANIFAPFYVSYTVSLQDVLTRGRVGRHTPVLVVERDAGAMVLLARQLTYHHVAQGELAGDPWMVSF
jgi:hypothetical protein